MKKILCLLLVVMLLCGCSMQPNVSRSPLDLPADLPSPQVPTVPATPAPSPSHLPEPEIEYVVKLPGGNFPDSRVEPLPPPPQFYGEQKFDLLPNSGYGKIYPYVGVRKPDVYGWNAYEAYGFFNERGEIICEPVYKNIYFRGTIDDGCYIIEETMEAVPGAYEEDYEQVKWICATDGSWIYKYESLHVAADGITVKQDGKWGFMDFDGNWVLKCKYEYPLHFALGVAPVFNENNTEIFYIDTSGKTVMGPYKISSNDLLEDVDEKYRESHRNYYLQYEFSFGKGYANIFPEYTKLLRNGEIIDGDWNVVDENLYYKGIENNIENGIVVVIDGVVLELPDIKGWVERVSATRLLVNIHNNRTALLTDEKFNIIRKYSSHCGPNADTITADGLITDFDGNVIFQCDESIRPYINDPGFVQYWHDNQMVICTLDGKIILKGSYSTVHESFITRITERKYEVFDLEGNLKFVIPIENNLD